MNELGRSEGEAQFTPVARQSVKTRPAQPCNRAASIREPEKEKGPSRRCPQGDRRTPLSDAENDEYNYRQCKCNEESRRHPRQCGRRQPADPTALRDPFLPRQPIYSFVRRFPVLTDGALLPGYFRA